ncbi:MAG: ABC transporter permease [Chloroflexota bacterium]|nr:ABC transporter permease [Chloroflexota bacterium]
MSQHILRRIMLLIPMLFGISIISYGIIRLAPGDPARVLADPEMLTTEQMEALRVQLGLDQPIAVQYLRTMQSLLTGDLLSFKTRQPVIEMIVERLPTTLALAGCVLVIGFTLGMAVGVLQALRPNSRLDDVLTFLSLFGFAVPSFWLALMLILIFSVRLDWLPASGIRPTNASGWNPLEVAPYLILPTIVLTANLLASVARYTRSSMLETLNQDYLRTARAKGLSERAITVTHALRNSLLPVITLLGVQIPYLLGGTVAIETIFALPGVGRLALDSVISRDYPVILTINVFVAVLVLIGNLLADIAYGLADPRVRLGE